MTDPTIAEYYQRGGELTRLGSGQGRLEYLRTLDVLRRHLPAPPAVVLDVGGATGGYARDLGAQGHHPIVVDPVGEQIGHVVADGMPGIVGDARRLPVATASVDAVLMLGPHYHLTARGDRVTAWREAARVARPGSPLVVATISRFTPLFDALVRDRLTDPAFWDLVRPAVARGVHRNPDRGPNWFTTAYFHHPAEIAAEAVDAGLGEPRLLAVETASWLAGSHLDALLARPDLTAALLSALREVEDEPSLLGASAHILAITHTDPRPPPHELG